MENSETYMRCIVDVLATICVTFRSFRLLFVQVLVAIVWWLAANPALQSLPQHESHHQRQRYAEEHDSQFQLRFQVRFQLRTGSF